MQRFGDRTPESEREDDLPEPEAAERPRPRSASEPPYHPVDVEKPEADALEQELPW